MNSLLQSLQLILLNIGYAKLDSQWDYDDVISPFSRLYYITEGDAKVYHNQQVFHLKKDHLYLIPSYTFSRYKCEEHMSQYYLSFLEGLGNGISIYNCKSFIYELPATPYDLELFKRILKINPNRSVLGKNLKFYNKKTTMLSFMKKNEEASAKHFLESKGILLSLFSRFIQDERPKNNTSVHDKRILQIMQYIREHLEENLMVEGLAARCHLHPDYFSRLFKKETSLRPLIFINKLRIERAQLLLVTTADSIPEVAQKVGFVNLSYFSRLFKKYTGRPPKKFRTEQWKIT